MINKKTLACVGLATVLAGVASPTVFADNQAKDETKVYFSSRNVAGGSGWAMQIPTAIRFSQTKTSQDFTLKLVSTPGHSLNEFASLAVTGTVTSQNDYALKDANSGKSTNYHLQFSTLGKFDKDNAKGETSLRTMFTAGTAGGGSNVRSASGQAKLEKKLPSDSGTFTDILTFKFKADYTLK